mgnify:FL=1
MNKGKMSITAIVMIAIGAVLFLTIMWGIGSYNGFVGLDKEADRAWGNVGSAYQRRADLIPNLVETVTGARDFEKSTQVEIAELRSQAGKAQIDVKNAQDAETLQAAGSQMNSVLSRLLVIVENYPDLKSNQNFLALQDEIAGTENRIKFERDNYNKAVKDYQVGVKTFPGMFIARLTGFSQDKHKMFQADVGVQTAPKVTFG